MDPNKHDMKIRKTNRSLQNEVDILTTEIGNLREHIQRLTERNSAMTVRSNSFRDQTEEYATELARAKSEIEHLEAKYREALQLAAPLERTNAELAGEISTLKAEIAHMEEVVKHEGNVSDRACNDAASLRAKIEGLSEAYKEGIRILATAFK